MVIFEDWINVSSPISGSVTTLALGPDLITLLLVRRRPWHLMALDFDPIFNNDRLF